VKITVAPDIISYTELINIYWHQTDPTDAMGQFQDRGDNYRPVIFVNGPEQRRIAEASKRALQVSERFSKPIVTAIEDAKPFYPAEARHQRFYKNNPVVFAEQEAGGRADFIAEQWADAPKVD
ncbi:MAG: peptide-methionine (S)-S-oxide reductase, partial [Lactiplantibacillus plantarum]|nr:peptide-methionine (S)-S-oxide reductase [Lactiplantibacillus plantarum]